MKLLQLLKNVDVLHIVGEPEGDVSSVCYDSKSCGRNSLFVAITGLLRDGRRYIPEAIERGANFIIHEGDFIPPRGATAIKVGNARRALGVLGKNLYRHPSSELCLVGVVGTNGKNTPTHFF